MKFTIRIAVYLSTVLCVLGNYGGAIEQLIRSGWTKSTRFVEGHNAIRIIDGETKVFVADNIKVDKFDAFPDLVARCEKAIKTEWMASRCGSEKCRF